MSEDIPKTLIDRILASGRPVSPELAELLAAYGPPPEMLRYQGDPLLYAQAVKIFERLSATPEAAARREAFERYFKGVRGSI